MCCVALQGIHGFYATMPRIGFGNRRISGTNEIKYIYFNVLYKILFMIKKIQKSSKKRLQLNHGLCILFKAKFLELL